MSGIAKNRLVSPFVKWVGGKRQLLEEITKYRPKKFSTYYEPFVGGGAVLFHLQPAKAVINDMNEDLINLYRIIKEKPEELTENLKKHKNDRDYFYKIRGIDRDENKYKQMSDVEKASRIVFLNKTCYNGLFRVNSSGEFNSPFGNYKNPNIINSITIMAVSKYLNSNDIRIENVDYEHAVEDACKSDFVYFDPPYYPVSNSSSFTGYTCNGFDGEQQERLKNVCDKLDRKGVNFLLSNSSTAFIRDLYNDYEIITVTARRSVNSNANQRGEIDEVLIKNYVKK